MIAFSVIIATYNRAQFICEAIDSVLNQTYNNFEVVVIDDGSTDGTGDIIKEKYAYNKKINYYYQENQERCISRNNGIEKANNKWICFLDSDDVYYPNHLSELCNLICKNQSHYVFVSGMFYNNKINQRFLKKYQLTIWDFINSSEINVNQVCINKEKINARFPNERIPVAEDWIFFRSIALQSNFLNTGKVTCSLREHEDRTMNVKKKEEIAFWNFYSMEYFINNNILQKTIKRKIQSYTYLLCSNMLLSAGNLHRGITLFLKSLGFRESLVKILFYTAILKIVYLFSLKIIGKKLSKEQDEKLEKLETLFENKVKIKNKDVRERIFQILYLFGIFKIFNFCNSFEQKIKVITFHRISDETDYAYPPINIHIFEKIIKYISKNYEVFTFASLANAPKTNKPRIIITFDDGYRDFVTNALPVLMKYNIAAVHNVVLNSVESGELFWTQRLNGFINFVKSKRKPFQLNNSIINISFPKYSDKKINAINLELFKKLLHINKNERLNILENLENLFEDYKLNFTTEMMNWADLKMCMDNNIEIGSHSVSHDSLDTISDDKLLKFELEHSKKVLDEKLGTQVLSFAFPNGEYNEIALKAAYDAGYKYILTTEEILFNYQPEKHVQIVPRFQIYYNRFYENLFKIERFHSLLKFFC